jgi:GT2 family glycosyltransferase
MRAPAISVVIPCYNLGAYLDEAVESVLAQTRQDFEVIVINDGSTDPETNRLLASYVRPFTRVLTTENRGLPAARNLGIREARGTFICALDADDKLDPTYFEKALRAFDDDPGLTFVSSWIQMFGIEDQVWRRDRCDLETLLRDCTVTTAAVTRRSAVESVGGYDENMTLGYQDWDLAIRLTRAGHRGVIVPETLFHYRRRAGSMSQVSCRGETHLALMRYLYDKHEPAYREHLKAVMLGQGEEIATRLTHLRRLEGRISTWGEPMVAHRRRMLAELEARELALARRTPQEQEAAGIGGRISHVAELERRLDEIDGQLATAAARLRDAQQDIAAIHGSTSWRVTSPLRALSRALGLRRGSGVS